MTEVTPHLKTVLKNYQHSATRSLQGPGLVIAKTDVDIKDDEYLQPVRVQQQLPILTTADTSCSNRTETILEDQAISCFVVGGEKRLCLPQVLNSVLREFRLNEINQECDRLQIFCTRCTPEQLNVLKNHGILPSGAPSCGLIKKTDAERLCSALLYGHHQYNGAQTIRATRKDAVTFAVYHECFGSCHGTCVPELFTGKKSPCIECTKCRYAFAPQQFVCHSHGDKENRTVHWGFDSTNWRSYLLVCKDQIDHEQYVKYLDEMMDRYKGKVPFPAPQPPPPHVENNNVCNVKRKQMLLDDVPKLLDMPLKKNKLEDYASLHQYNFHLPPAGLEYVHYIQEQFNNLSSSFTPFVHKIKETKMMRHCMNMASYVDPPPLLQHPVKRLAAPLIQTEQQQQQQQQQYVGGYQPNVALAPALPKKHRYMHKLQEANHNNNNNNHHGGGYNGKAKEEPLDTCPSNEVTSSSVQKNDTIAKETVIKHERCATTTTTEEEEDDEETTRRNNRVIRKSPDSQNNGAVVVDSTVSVVQSTGKLSTTLLRNNYSSEIELSTDTDDSASETTTTTTTRTRPTPDSYEDRSELRNQIDECLSAIGGTDERRRALAIFESMLKEMDECASEGRAKEKRIGELERRIVELERRLNDRESNNNNNNISNSTSCSGNDNSNSGSPPVDGGTSPPTDGSTSSSVDGTDCNGTPSSPQREPLTSRETIVIDISNNNKSSLPSISESAAIITTAPPSSTTTATPTTTTSSSSSSSCDNNNIIVNGETGHVNNNNNEDGGVIENDSSSIFYDDNDRAIDNNHQKTSVIATIDKIQEQQQQQAIIIKNEPPE